MPDILARNPGLCSRRGYPWRADPRSPGSGRCLCRRLREHDRLRHYLETLDESNQSSGQVRFESTPSSRYQAASSSLDTLKAHPILGSGLGTSPGHYHGTSFDSHCTPINIAATLGLPALVAFSAMLTLLWRIRKRPTDVALWSGFAGLALDALAQDVEDFRHVWVLFGLAASEPESQNAGVASKD